MEDVADVGDSPWPSRSSRWRECEVFNPRVSMRGVKNSELPPRPWMKMIGGPDAPFC